MQGDGATPTIRPVTAPMKQCPRCAELVKTEARACRFCGYDPETEAAAAEASARAAVQANDRQVTWAIAVVLIVVFVGLPVLFLATGIW